MGMYIHQTVKEQGKYQWSLLVHNAHHHAQFQCTHSKTMKDYFLIDVVEAQSLN